MASSGLKSPARQTAMLLGTYHSSWYFFTLVIDGFFKWSAQPMTGVW